MILQGIQSAFSEKHYSLLVTSPPSYEPHAVKRAELAFLRSAKENQRVAGVVMWDTGNAECHDLYRDLVNYGVPLVFVDRAPASHIPADVVAVNHRKAAQRAIHYLIELGHESIGMVIGNDRASSVLERMEGYHAVLQSHGIAADRHAIFHLDTDDLPLRETAKSLLRQICDGSNPPTALFAVNDRIAFHLLEAAEEVGIQIPEQLSLVGFDWLARWMPSGGKLTTIAQPFEELGQIVAERILSRIEKPTQTPRQILLEAELILKESAASPRTYSFSVPNLMEG